MKICFPVEVNAGLDSPVYNHFGSAPLFLMVDTDTRQATALNNRDQVHQHGACNPLKALGDEQLDGIVVGGIGGGALNGLLRMGLKVYRAAEGTVATNLDLFVQGRLPELTPQQTCGGHDHGNGHGGSCSH
ncbi:MAG: NifB/NifX family molybdenum-iron cluster-binding protein [Desulfuromonadales bacterium]|nr:NifB/NifX family molybdenum-iron cluster-binding protein [Desulfuromonadales bacterium]